MLQALPVLRVAPVRKGSTADAKRLRALRALESAIRHYLEVACRPLLSLPSSESPTLARHVRQIAMGAYDDRIAFMSALAELFKQAPRTATRLLKEVERAQDREIRLAREAFPADAAESYLLGRRLTNRAIPRVLAALVEHPEIVMGRPEAFERLVLFVPWLDLSQVAVSWFLLDREPWMVPDIARAACFLVKEWGLEYAAEVDALLARPRPRREAREADLTVADATDDRDFAVWASGVVAESLPA